MIAHVPEPQEAHMDLQLHLKTARQLEEILAGLGEHVPAKTSKKVLIERITAARGRKDERDAALAAALTITPTFRSLEGSRVVFDRGARDALHPQPVTLVEQKGTNRFHRRHRVQTMRTIDGQRVQYVTTIKKRWRRPATMVPATARQISIAYHQAFAPAPAGRSFFKGA